MDIIFPAEGHASEPSASHSAKRSKAPSPTQADRVSSNHKPARQQSAPSVSSRQKQPQQGNKWQKTGQSFMSGAWEGLQEMGGVLLHPVDNVVVPVGELLGDIGILASGRSDESRHAAADRMNNRWQNLKGAAKAEYTLFKNGDANAIARESGKILATVLTPGVAVKGVKVMASVVKKGVQEYKLVPRVGQKVYRVWGDEAYPYGKSWTRKNPFDTANYRDKAGLPDQNTGRFISEGYLKETTGIDRRLAIPLHGNSGGIDELIIPHPEEQIELIRVSGINPSF